MGLLASLLSAALATAKDLVSKRLAHRLDGTVSTFASFAFALPYYALLLAALLLLGRETLRLPTAFLVLVLLRSITDTFAEWLKMYAFSYGDISLVASFFSLSPLFLLITSPLITGDSPSWLGIVGVGLIVCGSLTMVYKPPAHDWTLQKKGILLATLAAVFFSLNSCFDRLAVQQGAQAVASASGGTDSDSGEGDLPAAPVSYTSFLTPVVSGFSMTLFSAAFLLPLVIFRPDRRRDLWDYRADFALRGFLEISFMVCKLYAIQFLQAPYVVGIQRTSLLLSIVGGRVFFKEQDFGKRLLAGGLILGGVLLIIFAQMQETVRR